MKDVSWIIGHNEWAHQPTELDTAAGKAASRKVDPKYNMTTLMRRRIAAHQVGGEQDVQLDKEDLAAIKAVVDSSNKFWGIRAVGVGMTGGGNAGYGPADIKGWAPISLRGQVATLLAQGAAQNKALTAEVTGLRVALKAVAEAVPGDVDYERIEALISATVREALADDAEPAPALPAARSLAEQDDPFASEEPGSVDPDATVARLLGPNEEDR